MKTIYKGLITLAALGAVACSGPYDFNGELTRKDDKGKVMTANVELTSGFKLTLQSHQRPILTEKFEGITNKYYMKSFETFELEEIVSIGNGKSYTMDWNNNPAAMKRGQNIVYEYKDSIDTRASKNLR